MYPLLRQTQKNNYGSTVDSLSHYFLHKDARGVREQNLKGFQNKSKSIHDAEKLTGGVCWKAGVSVLDEMVREEGKRQVFH